MVFYKLEVDFFLSHGGDIIDIFEKWCDVTIAWSYLKWNVTFTFICFLPKLLIPFNDDPNDEHDSSSLNEWNYDEKWRRNLEHDLNDDILTISWPKTP